LEIDMFDWMAWTTPVAVFFICIVLMLAGMTVWEINRPPVMRKGFLPIATTRGDRLFIGLLSAAYVNLAFVGISGKLAVWLGWRPSPVGLDQLRAVDDPAGADHAQGLGSCRFNRIGRLAAPGAGNQPVTQGRT
jgi:predicted small integral membrane protein